MTDQELADCMRMVDQIPTLERFPCPKVGCPGHRVKMDHAKGVFETIDAPCTSWIVTNLY